LTLSYRRGSYVFVLCCRLLQLNSSPSNRCSALLFLASHHKVTITLHNAYSCFLSLSYMRSCACYVYIAEYNCNTVVKLAFCHYQFICNESVCTLFSYLQESVRKSVKNQHKILWISSCTELQLHASFRHFVLSSKCNILLNFENLTFVVINS